MLQGSGSVELLAGSVSLGAEMNYLRPQPVPAGARLSVLFPWLHLACKKVKVAQVCPTLCDPMDGSPSGSSVHGILQARILE